MHLRKKISALVLLIVFMLSSAGIALSRHICYSQGIVEFSFLGDADCGEHKHASAKTSCCKKPAEESNTPESDCCNEDIVYAQLDIDLKVEEKIDLISVFQKATTHFTTFQPYNFITFLPESLSEKYPPPLLHASVNTFLSFISVFRL